MPNKDIPSHPVVSLDEVRALEARLLGGEDRREWGAMLRAGRSTADAALGDFLEMGGFPAAGRLLVLAGKGNNAGDALIAAREVLERSLGSTADVVFAFGTRALRPLAARAWRDLCEACRGRVRTAEAGSLAPEYDLCLDGIFGYQYRPPLPAEALAAVAAADRCRIRFRASVDLPSGLSEPGAFRADFTYATGSVKAPLLGCANAGRPRYLDLGFFGPGGDAAGGGAGGNRVILPEILGVLAGLRPAASDKRSQGHLAIVGGSRSYPGAVLMATMSALRSGVGLVTAFVPERLAAPFAARAPEAMWVGLPETKLGGLAIDGIQEIIAGTAARVTALAIGPGLGREPQTLALAKAVVTGSAVPLLIDADALQADIVRAGEAPRILTPHAGEFERISGGLDLRGLCLAVRGAVIAKGPVTRVSAGEAVYHCLCGGPVLARGGSGDLLAGLAGGLLAQAPGEPLAAACRAAAWHGMAADLLARAHGQAAVRTLQLLDFLAPVLREYRPCPPS
jgi:NAD(P)H-hydrate epimerase